MPCYFLTIKSFCSGGGQKRPKNGGHTKCMAPKLDKIYLPNVCARFSGTQEVLYWRKNCVVIAIHVFYRTKRYLHGEVLTRPQFPFVIDVTNLTLRFNFSPLFQGFDGNRLIPSWRDYGNQKICLSYNARTIWILLQIGHLEFHQGFT